MSYTGDISFECRHFSKLMRYNYTSVHNIFPLVREICLMIHYYDWRDILYNYNDKVILKHFTLPSVQISAFLSYRLQGKHFRILFIISPFISVWYVSIGHLYFDHIVNEAPWGFWLFIIFVFFMPSVTIHVYYIFV